MIMTDNVSQRYNALRDLIDFGDYMINFLLSSMLSFRQNFETCCVGFPYLDVRPTN